MKIIIADDDLTMQCLLEGLLKQWGYSVVVTTNGQEAIKALEAESVPTLVLLDWIMPVIDGIETCRRIRVQHSQQPIYVILVTVRDSIKDIVAGLEAGANDYIPKPFDREELHARVRVGERFLDLQMVLMEKVNSLENAMAHIKRLQGIIPICMHCHKIRNDSESWDRLETYMAEHTDANFSHGICPECEKKYYPLDASSE